MTTDEVRRERNRKASARRKNLAILGRPCTVDAAPTIKRVRALHNLGMTSRHIASLAGISLSTVTDLIAGTRGRNTSARPITRIPRTTQDAVFTVQPDRSMEWTSKNQVDGTGTRRRMRALSVQGFSYRWQAEELGLKDWAMAWELASNESRKVQVRTRTRVKAMYDKLDGVDPVDVGMHPQAASRTRNHAERHGHAGRGCWDDDTIDNPQAEPEWTGECGTLEGYYLHLKYGILIKETLKGDGQLRKRVLCDRCRRARSAVELANRLSYKFGAITDALRECDERPGGRQHGDVQRIAKEHGVSVRTIHRMTEKMRTKSAQPEDEAK